MSKPRVSAQPPGPKTAIRTGAFSDPFGLMLGARDHAEARDPGATVRRALAEEIRAQAALSARKKRRR